MLDTTPTNLNIIINAKELHVLKSFALGLSCTKIQELCEISETEFSRICSNLFSKLQVQNPYAAVRIAYHKNILREKDYTLENVKSLALEMAHKQVEKLCTSCTNSKKLLWVVYDLLMDFHTAVESNFLSNQVFVSK